VSIVLTLKNNNNQGAVNTLYPLTTVASAWWLYLKATWIL
jgi:hypothetical protein